MATTHQEISVDETPLAINFKTSKGNKRVLIGTAALLKLIEDSFNEMETVTINMQQ